VSRPSPPDGSRAVPGFSRLAVSREDELWFLADGRWRPVDPDASGMRRFMRVLVLRAWPHVPPWWPGPGPPLDPDGPRTRQRRFREARAR
jgi:hypothetical protein